MTILNMEPAEFLLLNSAQRDTVREPWTVRPLLARCALELQSNDEVRITLFDLKKLPLNYIAA